MNSTVQTIPWITWIDSSNFNPFGPCIVLLISKQVKEEINKAKYIQIQYNAADTVEVLKSGVKVDLFLFHCVVDWFVFTTQGKQMLNNYGAF